MPVVVLNNQMPYVESRIGLINPNNGEDFNQQSSAYPFNDENPSFFGSSSIPDPMSSSSSMSGSYSGGACSSGGTFDTLLVIAALAGAVFFLNQVIIINIGGKKRRISDDGQFGFLDAGGWLSVIILAQILYQDKHISGVAEFEEKIAN